MRRVHRSFLQASLGITLLVHTTSCSFTAGSMQPISITASDPAAQILVDGRFVGTGSASVQLERNRAHAVLARVGSRAGTASINRSVSTLGMLDIIGGFLILAPWLGVFAPGFWTLEPDHVVVAVPPPAR